MTISNKVTSDTLEYWSNYLEENGLFLYEFQKVFDPAVFLSKNSEIFEKFFNNPFLFSKYIYPATARETFSNLTIETIEDFHFLRFLTCVNFAHDLNLNKGFEHISCYYLDNKLHAYIGQTRILFLNMLQKSDVLKGFLIIKDRLLSDTDFKHVQLSDIIRTHDVFFSNEKWFDLPYTLPHFFDKDRDLEEWENRKLVHYDKIISFFKNNKKIYFNTNIENTLKCILPYTTSDIQNADVIVDIKDVNSDALSDCIVFALSEIETDNPHFSVKVKTDGII